MPGTARSLDDETARWYPLPSLVMLLAGRGLGTRGVNTARVDFLSPRASLTAIYTNKNERCFDRREGFSFLLQIQHHELVASAATFVEQRERGKQGTARLRGRGAEGAARMTSRLYCAQKTRLGRSVRFGPLRCRRKVPCVRTEPAGCAAVVEEERGLDGAHSCPARSPNIFGISNT